VNGYDKTSAQPRFPNGASWSRIKGVGIQRLTRLRVVLVLGKFSSANASKDFEVLAKLEAILGQQQ